MSLIKQISLKNTTYDIAADAQNISYGSNSNVKSKLDTLGTASTLDVAASGDASTTEVVKGDDSRLTDARNAADVSSWAKASTKPSYTASEVGAIATTTKGAANGVAELDANGKVPASQLPSYVDDVVDGYYNTTDHKFYKESTYTTEITGEDDKIYISLDTNITYRWGGVVAGFVIIGSDLALGETSSSAYRGDRGKTAYDHSQDSNKISSATASGLYKVAATAEGHIASLTSVVKSDITGLGIPAQDTTYGAPTTSAAGLVPQLPNDQDNDKFLRQDGTWATPDTGSGGNLDGLTAFRLSGILAAGSTSITFTDERLGADTCIMPPMTVNGLNPTSIVFNDTNHTYTLTFDEQESNEYITLVCFNFTKNDAYDAFMLSDTLEEGETTLIFTDNRLSTNTCVLGPLTENGINPISMSSNDSNHTYTLVFDEQESDVDVALVCFNFI